jgi:carotenoid cleavage dioxygenase-like enzyme
VRENFIDNLVKLDLEHNATASSYEEGCYPGEPVFVATPGRPKRTTGSYSRSCWKGRGLVGICSS